jgi:hypothetical protein
MIRYLGVFSVGGLFPTMVRFLAGVIPRLRAQATGSARLSAQLAVKLPTIQERLDAAARIAAALALTPPSVKFNVTANAQAKLLLEALVSLVFDLQAAFASAGVEAFVFSGPGTSARGEIGDALAGGLPGGNPGEHIDAFVLATRYPSTFTAMGKVFFV